MDGYGVVMSDGQQIGRVVEATDGYVLVERGRVFKSRRPVPAEFVHVDDARRTVTVTVAKSILAGAPKVDRLAELDEGRARSCYGTGLPSVPTDGRADADEPTVRERAAMRDELAVHGSKEPDPKEQLQPGRSVRLRPPPG